jgi:hypothetical protein
MVKVPGQLRKKKNARCLSKNHPEPPKSILENLQSHETSREKNAKNITHPNSSKTFRLYHMFFPNKIINKHGGNRKKQTNIYIYILYTIIIIIYIYIHSCTILYIYKNGEKKNNPPACSTFNPTPPGCAKALRVPASQLYHKSLATNSCHMAGIFRQKMILSGKVTGKSAKIT